MGKKGVPYIIQTVLIGLIAKRISGMVDASQTVVRALSINTNWLVIAGDGDDKA